ncbi:glycosyltransferase family 2 protein [soil metagenome]
MRSILVLFLQVLYTIGVLGLALYGFHAFWLTWKYLGERFFRRKSSDFTQYGRSLKQPSVPKSSPHPTIWPKVTIQLPIYNERHVIERLIDACARLNYPTDKLQIQILDDSTDETIAIVQQRVRYWQSKGIDMSAVQRPDRQGFKAGALAYALPLATGQFIAIFDADFAPPKEFLQRTIPHLVATSGHSLGFVQARWGHLNRDYSPLTRCQALALDGHFVVEQAGRQAAGYPFGFNGSAGVWRRACIEDPAVGGWQVDTLCEDLDLSYRAQLVGWQPYYLNDLEAPAEIPVQLIAFKRQQSRWAKGSIQTLRKLGRRVWCSEWPLATRLAALGHLGSYLIHPLLLLLLLITLPLMLLGVNPAPHLTVLSLASFGPPFLYAVAQQSLHPQRWWRHWAYLPLLTLLGTGVCLKNSLAVWQGLRSQGGKFERTPKFRVEAATDHWQKSSYRLSIEWVSLGEFVLLLYALTTAITAMLIGKWWSAPFLLIYAGGFGLMIFVDLWQTKPGKPDQTEIEHSPLDEPSPVEYKGERVHI